MLKKQELKRLKESLKFIQKEAQRIIDTASGEKDKDLRRIGWTREEAIKLYARQIDLEIDRIMIMLGYSWKES